MDKTSIVKRLLEKNYISIEEAELLLDTTSKLDKK